MKGQTEEEKVNKSIIGAMAVVLVLIIGIGAYLVAQNGDNETNTSESQSTNTNQTTETAMDTNIQEENPTPEATDQEVGDNETSAGITIAQVAMHSTEDDCWTIVDGNVYNTTEYVPRHPGGDEILLVCGKDGSSLFNQRQTEDGEKVGSGTPHSNSASNQLQRYLVGPLAN